MGRSYNDAGLIGYQGIKFLHREEIPKMSEPETYSLTELIKREFKNGKSAEKLAKTYAMSLEEINQIIGEVSAMPENDRIYFTDELFRGYAEKFGIDLDKEQFQYKHILEIAKDLNRGMQVISREAARKKYYTSIFKNPKKEKTEAPEMTEKVEAVEVNTDYELMEMIDTYDEYIEQDKKKRAAAAFVGCLTTPLASPREMLDEKAKEYGIFPYNELTMEKDEIPEEFGLKQSNAEELKEIRSNLRYEIWIDKEGNTKSETYDGEVEDIITLLKWQGRIA